MYTYWMCLLCIGIAAHAGKLSHADQEPQVGIIRDGVFGTDIIQGGGFDSSIFLNHIHRKQFDACSQQLQSLGALMDYNKWSIRFGKEEWTPLHIACYLGSMTMAQSAIHDCGNTFQVSDIHGNTPNDVSSLSRKQLPKLRNSMQLQVQGDIPDIYVIHNERSMYDMLSAK